MSANGFDRLRPRAGSGAGAGRPLADVQGKRALFSDTVDLAPTGSVLVTCSRCGRRSAVRRLAALRVLVPSVHVWPLRRRYPSWVRCPDCGQRAWARLSVRL